MSSHNEMPSTVHIDDLMKQLSALIEKLEYKADVLHQDVTEDPEVDEAYALAAVITGMIANDQEEIYIQ